jgi:beta-glucanase (GH16 family)
MPPCPSGDYHLVFEDNFDGNTLDMSTWNPITGVPRDNELEHQKAWHLPANIEVSDGTLKIFGKKLTSPYTGTWVSDWSTSPPTTKTSDFDFSTGEIWTDKKFLFGKYEARCRVPIGKGYWPAFWTYGDDQRWNEIDIFELYGDDADRFTCNVHHDYNGDGGSEMCSFDQNNAVNSFADWHTFTCIFEFDRIIWQIDGVTVRSHFRFRTLSAAVVTCEDNISVGSYVTQQAFPLDSMHIVFNLAIQSNENAPDDNTIFPGMFEIDYVRYYKKFEKPCIGCLDHIIYENTTQLPELTRTSNYIKATSNTTVQNGQNVRFKAPVIILEPSFEVEIGANFSAIPENCTLLNFENAPVSFIGDNTIDGYQLISSTLYTIEATGVLFYSFKVYDLQGQLVHNISGVPSSNQIVLWNTIDIATAWYSVTLELLNCTDTLVNEYNLLVSALDKSLLNYPHTSRSCINNGFVHIKFPNSL